jgi:hypothetical protein
MPSDRKLELKAKTSMAQIASQVAVYAKGLIITDNVQFCFEFCIGFFIKRVSQ